jgi:two-component system, chemotaxis family, protein-glutamate methylesterase/glutaminase
LPASLFIVLHIPAQSPSLMPDILSRAGPLPAIHPVDGEEIRHGHIYVAPPDYHLLLEQDHMRVVRGPKENRHRPAVDPLFRSAAVAYGPRVVGVILTGSLDDGTAGLWAVKRRGGVAIVQDPNEALYPGMPGSALAHVQIDYRLPLTEIGATLVQLAHQPTPEEGAYPVPDDMEQETQYTEMQDADTLASNERLGAPSAFSCPECGGVLWELHNGELVRFRCRVGHAFSIESGLAAQTEQLEAALWTALKTLEESASLSKRMAQRAQGRSQDRLARNFQQQAHNAEQRAITIRQVLRKDEPDTPGSSPLATSHDELS